MMKTLLKKIFTKDEIAGLVEMLCKLNEVNAKAVKKLAEKYSLEFLPLQDAFDKAAEKTCASDYLYDGVHPDTAGARLIADEWMKLYKGKIK